MAQIACGKPFQPGDKALYMRPQFGGYYDCVRVKKVMGVPTNDRYLIDRGGKRFWVRRAALLDREEAQAMCPQKAAIWWHEEGE